VSSQCSRRIVAAHQKLSKSNQRSLFSSLLLLLVLLLLLLLSRLLLGNLLLALTHLNKCLGLLCLGSHVDAIDLISKNLALLLAILSNDIHDALVPEFDFCVAACAALVCSCIDNVQKF
jgi:hypothetical protein